MCLLRFYCVCPLTLPSFEVVLERGEEGSFLNIYKLQDDSVAKGRGHPIGSGGNRLPPKKQTKQMAPKVIFQMATVKGSLCVLKNLLQPTLD